MAGLDQTGRLARVTVVITCEATAEFLEWCAEQLRRGRLKALSIELPEGRNARASVMLDGIVGPPPGCLRVEDNEDDIETEPGVPRDLQDDECND